MAKTAELFCARWYRNETRPSLLVLAGVTGTGKSRVARTIHRWVNAHAMDAFSKPLGKGWGSAQVPYSMMVMWPEVTEAILAKNLSAVDDMKTASLLVIDDVGAENDPWKQATNVLCQVLSRREFQFTVVTTNIMPTKWAKSFDARIADRFARNSEIVQLENCGSYSTKS